MGGRRNVDIWMGQNQKTLVTRLADTLWALPMIFFGVLYPGFERGEQKDGSGNLIESNDTMN